MLHRAVRRMAVVLCVLLLLTTSAFARTANGSLCYGDKGDEVRQLQEDLKKLGYQIGTVDGSFGAYTENAVRKFQKKNGLKVDGLVGEKTLAMISSQASGVQTQVTAAPSSQSAQPIVVSGQATTTTSTSGSSYFQGNYSTIRPGDKGSRVTLLQSALNAAGYSCGKQDGVYGSGTKAAVQALQRAEKLTVDGIAGRVTLTRLETLLSGGKTASAAQTTTAAPAQTTTSSSTTVSAVSRTLYPGYTGDDVKLVQQQLKLLGYYTGSVDGKYGTSTTSAVSAFQRSAGLTVDGIAGKKTFDKLFTSQPASATAQTASQVQAPTDGSYRNLSYGATGSDVTSVQSALYALGYSLNVSGTYDQKTVDAVKLFQKSNGLTMDGVAGPNTQKKLYSGSASGPVSDTSPSTTVSISTSSGPSKSEIKLLHWFNDIKPTLKSGQNILVYEPNSGISWTLRLYSLGRHADAEPATASDTAAMLKAFGGVNTWTQKAVYVRLPNGTWTLGSTHDMPHMSGSVKDNNFNGHLCVHFLRDMSEAEKNDPSYGVSNQKTIRAAWKALTGEEITK